MERLEPIQISGLGRQQVFIGNLYDYMYHRVLRSDIQVPRSSLGIKHVSSPEIRHSIFYQQPLKFIHSSIGIDSHVKKGIEKRLLDPNQFWFTKYLDSTLKEANYVGARLTIHFRVVRRTETVDRKFLQTQLQNYQDDCNGRATHVVKQVSYGSEFIFCIRKPVDYNQQETKESIEHNMFQAAMKYFDKVIKTDWTNTEIPIELADVSCTIFNNLNVDHVRVDSLQHSVDWLKSAIKLDGSHKKWLEWIRPVKIVLHHIPTRFDGGGWLLSQILSNKEKDAQLEIERIWYDLWNECQFLESHRVNKILNNRPRIPLKASPFCLHNFSAQLNWVRERFTEMKADQHAPIKDLLSRASQWIGRRRKELEILDVFCDELDRLPFVHMHQLKSLPPKSNQQNMKLFIILFEYKQDALLSEIENLVSNLKLMPSFRRTIFRSYFPICSTGKESLSIFKNQLKDFVEEAKRCANANNFYKFGLVPVDSNPTPKLKNGEIKTIVYPAIKNTPSQSCLPANPVQQVRRDPIPPGALSPPNSTGAPSTSRQIDSSLIDSKLPNMPGQQQTNLRHQQDSSSLNSSIPTMVSPANPSSASLPSTSNQERINEKLPHTLPSLLKRQLHPAPKASPATMPTAELNIEKNSQGPPLKKAKTPAVCTERIQTRSQTKVRILRTQENAEPATSCNSLKKSSSTPNNRGLLLESLLELEVLLDNIENLERKNVPGSDISECVVAKTSLRPSLNPCSDGFKAYNCRRCRVSCEKPSKQFHDITERKNCELCPCPLSDHALQPFEWNRKRIVTEVKISSQNMLQIELLSAKEKVLSLLGRMSSKNIPSLDSTANRTVVPSSLADYLELIEAHINQQRPGSLTRLKTLADLRKNVFCILDSGQQC